MKYWGLVGVATSLCFGLMCFIWPQFLTGTMIDLDVYVRGGKQVLTDSSQLYETTGILPFTYPPLAALIFAPLAALPAPMMGTLFMAGSLLCWVYVVSAWASVACQRWEWSAKTHAIWVAVLVLLAVAFEPIRATFGYGQINLYLAAMLTLAWKTPKAWLRGPLLALCISIKLTPAIFGLWLLARRDWRGIGWTAASGIAGLGLSFAIMPTAFTRYWVDGVGFDASRVGPVGRVTNQSINGVLWRLLGDGGSRLAWMVLAIVVAIVAYCLAVKLVKRQRDDWAFLVVAFSGLLISPISWSHHWVWLVPAALLLTAEAWATRSQSQRHQVLDAADTSEREVTGPGRISRSFRSSLVLAAAVWILTAAGIHWLFNIGQQSTFDAPLWKQFVIASYVIVAASLMQWAAQVAAPGDSEPVPDTWPKPLGWFQDLRRLANKQHQLRAQSVTRSGSRFD